ncbi:MAG TPA: hypothetical protein VKV40_22500 [Ktedonobacteraceae bacterium]|nr:hypothetical protein [Ktedonobacteraceae bacterium]
MAQPETTLDIEIGNSHRRQQRHYVDQSPVNLPAGLRPQQRRRYNDVGRQHCYDQWYQYADGQEWTQGDIESAEKSQYQKGGQYLPWQHEVEQRQHDDQNEQEAQVACIEHANGGSLQAHVTEVVQSGGSGNQRPANFNDNRKERFS